ncbi:hypothetical protein BB560_003574, partial [Smittium megazygosporum]
FNSLFNDIQSFSSSLAKSCKRTFSKQEDFIDALNLSMEMAGYLYFLETASPYKLDLHLPWDNNDDDSIKLNSEFIQIEFKPVNISVGKLFSILIYTTMSSLVIEQLASVCLENNDFVRLKNIVKATNLIKHTFVSKNIVDIIDKFVQSFESGDLHYLYFSAHKDWTLAISNVQSNLIYLHEAISDTSENTVELNSVSPNGL